MTERDRVALLKETHWQVRRANESLSHESLEQRQGYGDERSLAITYVNTTVEKFVETAGDLVRSGRDANLDAAAKLFKNEIRSQLALSQLVIRASSDPNYSGELDLSLFRLSVSRDQMVKNPNSSELFGLQTGYSGSEVFDKGVRLMIPALELSSRSDSLQRASDQLVRMREQLNSDLEDAKKGHANFGIDYDYHLLSAVDLGAGLEIEAAIKANDLEAARALIQKRFDVLARLKVNLEKDKESPGRTLLRTSSYLDRVPGPVVTELSTQVEPIAGSETTVIEEPITDEEWINNEYAKLETNAPISDPKRSLPMESHLVGSSPDSWVEIPAPLEEEPVENRPVTVTTRPEEIIIETTARDVPVAFESMTIADTVGEEPAKKEPIGLDVPTSAAIRETAEEPEDESWLEPKEFWGVEKDDVDTILAQNNLLTKDKHDLGQSLIKEVNSGLSGYQLFKVDREPHLYKAAYAAAKQLFLEVPEEDQYWTEEERKSLGVFLANEPKEGTLILSINEENTRKAKEALRIFKRLWSQPVETPAGSENPAKTLTESTPQPEPGDKKGAGVSKVIEVKVETDPNVPDVFNDAYLEAAKQQEEKHRAFLANLTEINNIVRNPIDTDKAVDSIKRLQRLSKDIYTFLSDTANHVPDFGTKKINTEGTNLIHMPALYKDYEVKVQNYFREDHPEITNEIGWEDLIKEIGQPPENRLDKNKGYAESDEYRIWREKVNKTLSEAREKVFGLRTISDQNYLRVYELYMTPYMQEQARLTTAEKFKESEEMLKKDYLQYKNSSEAWLNAANDTLRTIPGREGKGIDYPNPRRELDDEVEAAIWTQLIYDDAFRSYADAEKKGMSAETYTPEAFVYEDAARKYAQKLEIAAQQVEGLIAGRSKKVYFSGDFKSLKDALAYKSDAFHGTPQYDQEEIIRKEEALSELWRLYQENKGKGQEVLDGNSQPSAPEKSLERTGLRTFDNYRQAKVDVEKKLGQPEINTETVGDQLDQLAKLLEGK